MRTTTHWIGGSGGPEGVSLGLRAAAALTLRAGFFALALPRLVRRDLALVLAAAMRKELTKAPGLDPALWAPFTVYLGGE
jgi:hypothetical protein